MEIQHSSVTSNWMTKAKYSRLV